MVGVMSERHFVSQLTDEDITYLSIAYQMDEGFVRSMTDIDFCAFLGCETRDLPFYLFASDDQVDRAFSSIDLSADEVGFEDYDYSDPVFDLDYYIDNLPDEPVRSWQVSPPNAKVKKTKTTKVPHYFVVVK